MPSLPGTTHLYRLEARDGKQTDYTDSGHLRVPGLILRVSPTGNRKWVIKARRPGHKNASRFVLADLREMTLTEARLAALDFKSELRKGVDPVTERTRRISDSKQLQEERGMYAFGSVVQLFLLRHVHRKLKPKTGEDYTRVTNLLIGYWGDRDIRDISKADIVHLVDSEEDRAYASARLTFSITRKFFNFALERGLVDANPCAGISGPSKPVARDRWLSDSEIILLWKSLDQLSSLFVAPIRFLLATAQRRTEVAEMTWAEVDLDHAIWTIPKERAKNGKAHEIDLPPLALAILTGQMTNKSMNSSSFVFGTGKTLLSGWSKAKRSLDAIMFADNQVPAWRIHDLRRTAATHMAGLGFAPHIVERVLNHVSGASSGLVAVYQHHEHRDERKAAISAWNAKVEKLVVMSEDESGWSCD
jgi:integrase